MPAITDAEIGAAYALGRRVDAGELDEALAVSQLVDEHGMDRGSAAGYVRQVGHFLGGKRYTRTINDAATRYYLAQIRADYGQAGLQKALRALALHVDYYEQVSGAKRPSLRAILVEFEPAEWPTLTEVVDTFDRDVARSRTLTPQQREALLSKADTKPKTIVVTTKVFIRNPHVVAAALARANGFCELCKKPAPFIKKTDGAPFLEVHHVTRLASNGDDTLKNVLALCPNCHRQQHYG